LATDEDPDESWDEELEFDDGTERETIDQGRSDTAITSCEGE
jgi:hypothetical protein